MPGGSADVSRQGSKMGPDVKSAGQGKERIKLWVQEQPATIGVPSSAGQDLSEGTNEDTRQGVPLELEHGLWRCTYSILKTYFSC